MEVNGIAHVMLTVSDFDSCLPFYEQLLGFLGLRPVLKADGMLYCVGGPRRNPPSSVPGGTGMWSPGGARTLRKPAKSRRSSPLRSSRARASTARALAA